MKEKHHSHCYHLLFHILFLALDTGHLWIPAIHEDTHTYLTSGNSVLVTCFPNVYINIPQCHHFVTGPCIYLSIYLVSQSQPHSPEQRNVFLHHIYAASHS